MVVAVVIIIILCVIILALAYFSDNIIKELEQKVKDLEGKNGMLEAKMVNTDKYVEEIKKFYNWED